MMKRRRLLITGVLLLLLGGGGAIVNVAVAWGIWLEISNRTNNIRYFYSGSDYVCGWPMASMRQNFGGAHVLIPELKNLPLNPVWPGFAINTIFYAAMLWVVFFVPGMVRRRIRRRRGRCPACAYPIGTSPVCTECGKPLKIRTGMGLPPPATPAPDTERTT